MKKLTLRVSKRPDPTSPLSTRRTHLPKRVLKQIFGTTNPGHQVAIILPGNQVEAVDVRFDETDSDDLTALLDAVQRHPAGNRLNQESEDADAEVVA